MFGRTTSVSGGLEAPLETQMGVGVVLITPPRHFAVTLAAHARRGLIILYCLQNGGEYAENRILSSIIYGPRPRRHMV